MGQRIAAGTSSLLALTLLLWGCSDSAATGSAGSGGSGAAAAGSGAGVGGTGGSAGAGSGGSGGSAGAGSGGSGGSGGSTADGGNGDAGSPDAGSADGGMPQTGCQAPSPAAVSGNSCPASDPVTLKLSEVAGGFTRPVFVTAAPGDDTRLFVVERGGDIKIIDGSNNDSVLATPFASVPMVGADGANSRGGERGLLGFAFHPEYPSDPRFFVNYFSSSNTTVVRSFEESAANANLADLTRGAEVVSFPQPASNHNGGMIAFGPDGCLFVGTGDGGGGNDGFGPASEGNGQNLGARGFGLDPHLGKVLRFDVDATAAAAPGNMGKVGADGIDHIWDYGLRNPWRFSFDRSTGDLYIGDVGQDTREEINAEAGGTGHLNYGWKITEGSDCRGGGSCDKTGLTPPVDELDHYAAAHSMIGGYVYRGTAIPSLQGWYVYGDYGSNRIWAFTWDGSGRCGDSSLELTSQLDIMGGDITSFGEDAAGELYVVVSDGTSNGRIYRIEAE